MAGLIRVRSVAEQGRRRAGLTFSREWAELDGTQVNEAQFLAILEDGELQIEYAMASESPEWRAYPDRDAAIEVLREHVAYDLDHDRPHDPLVQTEEFQSAQEAEGEAEPGAPDPADAEAKDDAARKTDPAASSADLLGTASAAAAEAEDTREGAEVAAAGQGGATDEENQPEHSLQAPVAAHDTEDTGEDKPAGSRRRARNSAA